MYSLREKVYQMFILGTDGGGWRSALSFGLGGLIFFFNDFESESQIKKVTDECKNLAFIPPFLSVDQEGGRVERTEKIRSVINNKPLPRLTGLSHIDIMS